MKTLKIMSIIGITLASISLLVIGLIPYYKPMPPEIAWGLIISTWSLAYSIVGLVQSNRNK